MTANNQHFRLRGSARGGLHASSIGENYPWSVQPRVRVTYKSGGEHVVRPVLSDVRTVWVAFNAITGETVGTFLHYRDAEQMMHCKIEEERIYRENR